MNEKISTTKKVRSRETESFVRAHMGRYDEESTRRAETEQIARCSE